MENITNIEPGQEPEVNLIDAPVASIDEDLFDLFTKEAPETPEEGEVTPAGQTQDSVPKIVYDMLVEKNYIDKRDDFEGTFEALEKEILTGIPNKVTHDLISQAPEPVRAVVEYITQLGDGATKQDIIDFLQVTKEDNTVSLEDLSQIDKAREYMAAEYKARMDIDQDDLDLILDKLEDKDVLVERAQKVYNQKVAERQQAEAQKINEQKRLNEQRAKAQQDFQEAFNKELQGTQWSENRQEEIRKQFSPENIQNKLTQIYNDPKSFMHFLNILTYHNGKDFDFEGFAKSHNNVEPIRKNMFRDRFKVIQKKGGYLPDLDGKNVNKLLEEFVPI